MEWTLGLHPGSSLLKNLKKKRASINTLDKFSCKSSCSESLFFLQKKERWTQVRVASGFYATTTNDRLVKAEPLL